MSTVTANDVRICFEEAGDGPAVVLLGGSGMSAGMWDFSIKPMRVEAGLHVVAIDPRGSGGSEAPPPPYSITYMASDIAGVVDELASARAW